MEDDTMDSLTINTTAPVVGAEAAVSVQQTVATQTITQVNKAVRFKTGAENQASKILSEIEKMKKLSNRKYYTYTPEQISELFTAMHAALDEVQASFTADTVEKKKLFTFSA